MDTSSSCQSCGQPISKDELAEGLAVRVDGRLVCSSCVDQLPGEAQVRINQLRAVRGLAATTYRVAVSAHPQLRAFTFTTSINLNLHRRELVSSGHFDAPLLPATGTPKLVRPPAPNTSKRPPVALIAGGAVALATVGVVVALVLRSGSASTATTPSVPSTGPVTTAPAAPSRTRTDYAADASVAWNAAVNDSQCPMSVLQTIAGELVNHHGTQITAAEKALEAGDHHGAAEAMALVEPLPDHLLFRTANKHTADLSDRIRMARINATAVKPAPTPVKPPDPKPPAVVVTPPVPEPEPPIVAVVTPPIPKAEPVVPVVEDNGDCLLFKANTLSELPGHKDWKAQYTTGKMLVNETSGSLVTSLTVTGGTYQLWLKARATTTGSIAANINGTRAKPLELPKLKAAEWQHVETPFTVPSGTIRLLIVAIGSETVVSEIYLADVRQPPPAQAIASKLTTDPSFTGEPTPKPLAAPRPQWIPHFAETHPALDPAVEANRVPPGLPGNASVVLESVKGKTGGRHCFTVEFTPADVNEGGLAVLLSPRRADRTTLSVTATDDTGRKVLLDNLVLGKDPWQIHTINLAHAAGAQQVLIEDTTPLSTGFLIAKISAIAGAAPTAELLELRPPALLPLDAKRLDDELTFLAARRKAPGWRKTFDPRNLKVLIGEKLAKGSWDTDARKRLAEVMEIQRLPNKTIEELVMNDGWLNDLIKPPAGSEAVLDPTRHHLVIICTAGIEFPTGLDGRQAFVNVWKKLIDAIRGRGVLPVPVLGPSKVDGDDKPEVEKLWNDLADWLTTKYPGIPVIDLRPAAAVSADRFAPGGAQLSIDLLGDGYGTLLRRIEMLNKSGR